MADMFEVVEEKTFITISAGNLVKGDINVDGAKCLSALPRRVPHCTGRRYVDIVWDDAPLVTHVVNADRQIIIEG